MTPRIRSALTVITAVASGGCTCPDKGGEAPQRTRPRVAARAARLAMVREQIVRRGVRDPRVLAALRQIPRHEFVPRAKRPYAYEDRPLGIGEGQTISQPYIVAFMTEALQLRKTDRVLEIGTGSGYQAAVLAEIARHVYTIEIVRPLAIRARRLLQRLGYRNLSYRIADGYLGWPEAGPFDAIILTAAPPRLPPPLLAQLRVGGRLVAPVGRSEQALIRITRTPTGYERERLLLVRFVPMTGKALER